MTVSTTPLVPSAGPVLGTGAVAEPTTLAGLVHRASQPDYDRWLAHITPAAGCRFPVRLTGRARTADANTGEVLSDLDATRAPDGVLYTPCGNRRATVCPSCAETYRSDTFHLVHSGLLGGKGVPETVAEHPTVFVTLAAPSFGEVHAAHKSGKPCHPRRNPHVCPHGVTFSCLQRHESGDEYAGRPFCLDCYDHHAQVVFNSQAGELWRRTTINLRREITRLGKSCGAQLRISFAKVAEFQARGVVHFHALIRLDGYDPDNPAVVVPPDPRIHPGVLEQRIRQAAEATTYRTPRHPDKPDGWLLHWGHRSIDTRQVQLTARDTDEAGALSDHAVAGYLAKYATKATEDTGHVSRRLTHETVGHYADPHTHPGRLIAACWYLGQLPDTDPDTEHAELPDFYERRVAELDDDVAERLAFQRAWARLHRWAHQLGFGGHFSTKSRRYSTTLGALRAARRDWNRTQPQQAPTSTAEPGDEPDILTLGHLTYAGIGWHTNADAQLANTAAAKAREQRQAARDADGQR
ncbi:replication initiator protein RepSA [Salinifilum aidingensis]